ncbi:MAG: hypothetical protein NAG76_15525 [Candidatus Pristimantibacillus lignocellulolyticus]|uniref:Uncharacterized protein n=1 Tax=Candidatus Pristimantibacillus lignocellulolyticus TaxID=2994561 RepID=A0A9J6ZBL1_9BACL|nr:MAG: hypothetical protein NAG76_15525 [Candidatus Pristimantibacillus lignocellulolyticus]
MYIYIYRTQREAQQGLQQFFDSTATANLVAHEIYQVKNSLVFSVGSDSEQEKKIALAMNSFIRKD